ncbi:hypothetical protein DACRYDRAFT_22188 [Dacryopinax primogenitus]|uniref:Nucleic acid-binding protein n=1 Tax=Dacryopinax primogenitus (strain DJM 731) TaxID=1858805 RepID=M5G0X5_DACPD|nr:uncharacterized protein DACRYDRAFT_22188 [Dacryopinax primogenitus]EJU01795.1 hypothetical protein DACRYDRAFT_22188 [Dacryopinax primogenitus]
MLSPKLNKYIEEGGIQSGAFLQIESVNRKTVAGYRSITVTRGVPVGTPGDICGSPTEISLRVGAIVPTDPVVGTTPPSCARTASRTSFKRSSPSKSQCATPLVPKDRADGGHLRSNGGSKQQPSASQSGGEGRSVTIKSITASKAVANGGQPQGRQAYGGLNKNSKVISMHPHAKVSVPNVSSNIQALTSSECQPKSSSAATGLSAANGQSPASANAVSTVKTTQHFNLSNFITAVALEHVEPTRIAFSELNAGLRFDWMTYGRIYEISGPHRWKNKTKEGFVLTLKIVDKDGNKMLVGSFDPVVIERVMAEAVVGKVMKLSNVRVCPVKEEFLQPDILPLQMMLKYNSTFSFPNSDFEIPAMPMQLTGIHLLRGLEF